ncbi:MAG: PEGA domain-containing protein [Deltaproteobacteria bacterium]
MVLRWDELRKTISRRTIDFRSVPGGQGHLLAVQLDLRAPLDPADVDVITQAGHQAANAPIEGVIGPRLVEVSGRRVTILLDPVSNGAMRVDTLLTALRHKKQPLGAPLAASVAITAAGLLQQINDTPGFDAPLRVHGEVHKGAVLLAPGGSVAVLGPGLPAIQAMLLPPLTNEVDRFRILAPEAARGEPLDRRADVYSLGVLYYELVTGRPYLDHLTAALVCQRAIEGQPPSLSSPVVAGRPGLLPLFERALAPNRDDRFSTAIELSDAIYDELESVGLQPGGARELAAVMRAAVPPNVGRGPMALLTSDHDAATFGQLLDSAPREEDAPKTVVATNPLMPDAHVEATQLDNAPVVGTPSSDLASLGPRARSVGRPAATPLTASEGSSPVPAFGDWGSVLQQEVTGINKVPEIARAAAAEFATPEVSEPPKAAPLPAPEPPKPSGPPSSSGLRLPTPSDDRRPAPTAPVIDDSKFEGLQDALPAADSSAPRSSRPTPPVIIEDGGSIGRYVAIGAAVVVLVGLGIAIASRTSTPTDEIEPMAVLDAGVTPTPDAGTSVAVTPPPPPPPPVEPPRTTAPQPTTKGYLTVMSNPSGASVELDNGFVGTTPLVLPHAFDNRFYVLRILADGHEPWERRVRPDERRSINVVATLAPK